MRGSGEDLEAEEAAHSGLFVVLLGQHDADERVAIRVDSDQSVGAAADLAVEAFAGYLESLRRCPARS